MYYKVILNMLTVFAIKTCNNCIEFNSNFNNRFIK